jgi:hypothetical protein
MTANGQLPVIRSGVPDAGNVLRFVRKARLNVFVKLNEQSQTCLNFAIARKQLNFLK